MPTIRERRPSRHASPRPSRGVHAAQPRIGAASRAALAEADEILEAIRVGTRRPQTLESFLAEMAAL